MGAARTTRLVPLAALVTLWACAEDSSPLRVVPTEPAHGRVAGGGTQAEVGATLPEPIVVTITDRYGNPVPDVRVRFSVTAGGGSVSSTTATTDFDGEATAEWTLGTAAGPNEVEAMVEGFDPFRFEATGRPGPPAEIVIAGGNDQDAVVESVAPERLVVEVRDRYDNPVPGVEVGWRVTSGGGSADPEVSATDEEGIAGTHWRLGPTLGRQTAEAVMAGFDAIEFGATGHRSLNVRLESAYISQSIQRYAGDVPLVADRPGYLRVFVTADRENEARPDVRVRFYRRGSVVESHTIPAPSASVPTGVDEGALFASWNLEVPSSLLEPGVSWLVEVDPDDAIPETDEDDNAFPTAGEPEPLGVQLAPPFAVRFVPVHQSASGRTGDVDAANTDEFLTLTEKVYPLGRIDADVRSVYTTDAPPLQSDNGNEAWGEILREIDALRVAEGTARYYYGVVQVAYTSGVAGIGYVGRSPAALGWDHLPSGSLVAAHEWGHNWARRHAPCGDPGNPDTDYPYANGSIGVYGFDVFTGELRGPARYADLMSYCRPAWISDYTYEGVLDFRRNEASAAGAFAAGDEASLVVSGRIREDELVLDPAFEVTTRPTLPREPGPYTLEGVDDAGTTVFRLSFRPAEVADARVAERHFAFAIPSTRARPDRLAVLRLRGAGLPAAERRAPPAGAPGVSPGPSAVRVDAQHVRVRWDAARHPLVVVRDPQSGEILSLARGGDAVVHTAREELELLVSDGLRTTPRTIAGLR